MSDKTIFQTLKQNLTETPLSLKKNEIYRKKAKKKAIKTLTRKKPSAKKTKTIKVLEPKEDDDDDPELVTTGFKATSHPRTRKFSK